MNRARGGALVIVISACLNTLAFAEGATVLAPGYGPLEYIPPTAGSYQLPALGKAVDGDVLDDNGRRLRLHELQGDKYVLMGFIYTHCPDINGCPLASYVMKQVQARLVETPELAAQVRLISLSFDPQLDTPEAMRQYARHFQRKGFDWQFLTTDSESALRPILEGYGQWRQIILKEDGSYAGSMSHILRVYLIDRQNRIRNIYSAGFLHTDTVVNDLETLLLEDQAAST
jgi:cytochrome c peroxidase